MRKRKFEEDVVVEETTESTTEVVEEGGPDLHEQFVNVLVDMGLSAEQAESVHQVAMDLVDAGGGEETTEEVKEETRVEASRERRLRRKRREMQRANGTPNRGTERRARRTEMSASEKLEKRLDRLERQNRPLRGQLREFGASPAAQPLRNKPQFQQQEAAVAPKAMDAGTARAFEMIKNYQR